MSSIIKNIGLDELLKIPSGENSEELCILNDISQNIVCQYEKEDMFPYLGNNIKVRKSVAEKLQRISDKLNLHFPDFKLKVVYGYRHPDIQKKYFEYQKNEIKKNTEKEELVDLDVQTHLFVADPRVAGHPTGAAIDITITSPQGDIDMGTSIADFSDKEKIQTFSKSITEIQKYNRKLLHDLMLEENFAPFYGEWWHFSYGDKEWASFYNKEQSLYSEIYL